MVEQEGEGVEVAEVVVEMAQVQDSKAKSKQRSQRKKTSWIYPNMSTRRSASSFLVDEKVCDPLTIHMDVADDFELLVF